MHLLLHLKGETVVALKSEISLISQDSYLRDVTTACEEFQQQQLLFLQSKHPENHLFAQDLIIIQEPVGAVETDEARTRRLAAEERVMALMMQQRELFGDGDWKASSKVCQAVLLRLSSVRAIDRLDFLLASST